MVSLKYSISKEDYINYYAYVVWDAPDNRKKRLWYYVKQLIPILLFLFAFYYTGIFERNSKFILLILGFIFLTSALSLFGVRSNTIKQAKKITDDPGNSSIFLERSLFISESGIIAKDALIEIKYQWEAFIKKQESREYYFLFTSSIHAIIIPKRIFHNDVERKQLEKLLSQYLSFDAEIGPLLNS
ncbi:MAG: YcxB family protein [Ferruginibacter sp.]